MRRILPAGSPTTLGEEIDARCLVLVWQWAARCTDGDHEPGGRHPVRQLLLVVEGAAGGGDVVAEERLAENFALAEMRPDEQRAPRPHHSGDLGEDGAEFGTDNVMKRVVRDHGGEGPV